MKKRTDPVTDAKGDERHPAFGLASVGRVHATPGETLFQSDVEHSTYMVFRVHEAARNRKTSRDWVHAGKLVCEVSMSMAQFASLVASVGTEGVPCTIEWTGTGDHEPGPRDGLKPATRFQVTHDEVSAAADKAYGAIQQRFAEYAKTLEDKAPAADRKKALSDLQSAIRNAAPNVTHAARTLDEHIEKVVETARADVDAMAAQAAERSGLGPAQFLAIEEGNDSE